MFNGSIYVFKGNVAHSDVSGMFTDFFITVSSGNSQYPHLNKQTQNNQTWQVKEKEC